MALKLQKHIKLSGKLVCKSGIRVGGSKEDLEVGGIDNPVIRDPVSRLPYIPGSSLKGKLRSLSEYRLGKVTNDGKPCGCAQEDCLVCKIFGPHMSPRHNLGPTRIIVRDAHLSAESKESLEALRESGIDFSEIKTENIIDRRTGIAADGGLRTGERVPAGTKFDLVRSIRIFDGDDEKQLINFLQQSLAALQNDTLGGSGTRGYGWVEIEDLKLGASSYAAAQSPAAKQ